MNDVCEMHSLQEGMGSQCVCEDSKVRVYLSLVRNEEEGKLRAREVQRMHRKKRAARTMILAAGEAIKLAFAAMAAWRVWVPLSECLTRVRGCEGIGGEIVLVGAVACAGYALMDRILGGGFLE